MEFGFAFFELVGETLAVFEFIEIGGDGMGCAFACWRAMSVSLPEGKGLTWILWEEVRYLKRSIPCRLARRL